MNKKKIIIISALIIIVLLGIYLLYNTFAINNTTNANNTYTINLTNGNNTIDVPSKSSKIVYYKINNTNSGTVKYGIGYNSSNIIVKVYEDSKDPVTGLISSNDNKFVKLKLINNSTSNDTVTLSTIFGYENGGNLIVPTDITLVTKIYMITMSGYITDLYNNSNKTSVVNNNTTYQYDTSDNLMQDIAKNIRYYGEYPNNYVYFNCDVYPDTNCELWRIIGVFDGKLKLIRNEKIVDHVWDTSASSINNGYGVNEWSDSDAMKLLNPGHESESVGGSLYYDSKSGLCYRITVNKTIICDFTKNGIKNDVTRNMIAETTWNLGGWDTSNIYSNVMYEKERGTTVISNPSDGITRTTTWTGKIALAYPSDYGFATDLSKCSQTLSNYDSSTDSYACRNNDWMYSIITNSGSGYGWLLTPSSSDAYVAFNVNSDGYVGSHNDVINYVYIEYGVAPVLYLGSDQDIVAGDGSQSNPYKLTGN